ncbi:MAG: AAA family ATPase [Bdellovibrionaceae bacterium]|nr:AAA family ATPase [Pseudobdellovibrionaceae bacterium]
MLRSEPDSYDRSYIMMIVASLLGAVSIHIAYPKYQTSATIYLNSADDSQLMNRLGKISGYYRNPYKETDEADKYLKLFEAQSFKEFIVKKILKEKPLDQLSEDDNNFQKLYDQAEDLLSYVEFKKADPETIIITGISTNPETVLKVVNQVAVFAKEAIIDLELTEIANSEKYLRSEMLNSKERLTRLSGEVEAFKNSRKDMEFSLSDKVSPLKVSISRLREELEVTKVQISRNEILAKQFNEQLENLRENKNGIYHPNDMMSSRGRLVDMIQAANHEIKTLSANQKALQIRLEQLQNDMAPGYEQKVYEFQKQIELEYSFYELLQENLFQSGVQSISVKNRVRSVDVPSQKNVIQKLPLFYKILLSMLLATLTTIIIVSLVEYFYPVVIGKKELINIGYHYLSHIPKMQFTSVLSPKKWIGNKNDMVVQVCADNPESQGGTAFRYLRVRFLQSIAKAQNVQKIISIGSSRPNEGKSFVSVNMSISLASVGKKVLLIDADERVASVSKLLSDLTADGLIQYCKGKANLESILIKNVYPNLDVLPVGFHVENEPIDILSSGKLNSICDELKSVYDFIIIDTPAFYAGADALLVYEIADRVIITLESNKTSMAEAHNVLDILHTIGHKNIYAVLNRYTEIFEIKPQNYYYAIPKRTRGEAA